jgi:hypothetical protein
VPTKPGDRHANAIRRLIRPSGERGDSSLVGLGVVVVGAVAFLETALELGLRLPHRSGKLGKLRTAEQDQDHDQDDEELGRS